ncbi:MAG: hypothetical protein AB7N80_08495 [Bdellovibrionales bacterium]
MGRLGTTSLFVIALAIGGAFEIAKRLSWVGTPATGELAGIGKAGRSVMRGRVQPLMRDRAIPGKPLMAHNTVNAIRTIPAYQKALMIPPTQGQFDSNAGQATAANKVAQGTKKDADKSKDGQKKCKPKDGSGESQGQMPAHLQALHAQAVDPTALAHQGAAGAEGQKQEGEEDLPDCEEDETVAKADDENQKEDDEDKNNDDLGANSATPTFGGGLATNNNKNAALAGLEEWKKRILDKPNFKETVRLIEAVQSGQISSALFYTLVNLMLQDSRIEMRELGVLAAGRTPSPDSYHILLDVIKHEAFGSRIRQRAEAELNIYEQVTYLWVLESVMRSSDDIFAVIWATKQLEDSARRYLNAKYNRPTPGNGSASTRNPYVSHYNRFVAVLQELSTSRGEQSLQARETLRSLQDLIKAAS